MIEPQHQGERIIKGLNFFAPTEQTLLRTLQRPEFSVHGMRRADIKPCVALNDSALSRQLHRLRALGLIKRVVHSYRYYLTGQPSPLPALSCSFRSSRQWHTQNDNFFANSFKTSVARDQKRTMTGAVVGVATGSWGWPVAGVVAGGTGGYVCDKSKKNEEKAYEKGVKDGKSSKPK